LEKSNAGFEDADQIGQPINHLLAGAELRRVVEVGWVRKLVGVEEWCDDVLVDLIADVGLPLQGDHVLEAGVRRDGDRCEHLTGVFVADVFDE
jgi:hypothetical protein